MSKQTLCPTTMSSPMNPKSSGRTSSGIGASDTMPRVIPVSSVMKGVTLEISPGLTRLTKRSSTFPPRTLYAATSMIQSLDGLSPVVSRSRHV